MDFEVKQKVQAQYNWKFWVKLSLGLIPIFSIIIFFSAQLADLIDDPVGFWNYIFSLDNGDKTRIDQFLDMKPFPLTYAGESDPAKWAIFSNTGTLNVALLQNNWSTGRMIEYGIFRNIGMITTLGNVLACAFFLDSAVHNSNEGMGRKNNGGVLDTYRTGLAIINVQTFIVLAYNLSLVQSHATDIMKWYNYVSWMCEHLIVPILMIVYFFVFYPKVENSVVHYKKDKARNWFSFMWSSIAMVVVYNIFFTVLGFILKAAKAFPIFGDMSSNGYFPYNYMDFSDSNLVDAPMGMSHAVEFVLAMIALLIEQIVTFAIYFAAVQHQMKLNVKKQYWK